MMALPPAPELTGIELLALVAVVASLVGAVLLLRSGTLSRRTRGLVVGPGMLAALFLLFSSVPSDLAQLAQGQAVIRDRPYSDGGHTVAYPDGRVVDLLAASDDARAQICLQQAFERPGTITIQTLGKDAQTFKTPPPEVFAAQPSDWMRTDRLPYHTCELVDGQPVARVRVRPIEGMAWSR